jgi:hypothetical protein
MKRIYANVEVVDVDGKPTKVKMCSKCLETKPLDDFYKKANGIGGKESRCKDCKKRYSKEYENINQEKVRKRKRNYNAKHKEEKKKYNQEYYENNKEKIIDDYYNNKEKHSEYKKRYRKENKEKLLLKERKRYQEKRENILGYAKKYYASEKGKIAKAKERHKRRSLKKKSYSFVNYKENDWLECLSFFNHRCAYCGEESPLEKEHFIPLINGGEFTINNIIPACKSCNSSKNNKCFFDWYPNYRHYSRCRERKILKYLNYDKSNTYQQLSIL